MQLCISVAFQEVYFTPSVRFLCGPSWCGASSKPLPYAFAAFLPLSLQVVNPSRMVFFLFRCKHFSTPVWCLSFLFRCKQLTRPVWFPSSFVASSSLLPYGVLPLSLQAVHPSRMVSFLFRCKQFIPPVWCPSSLVASSSPLPYGVLLLSVQVVQPPSRMISSSFFVQFLAGFFPPNFYCLHHLPVKCLGVIFSSYIVLVGPRSSAARPLYIASMHPFLYCSRFLECSSCH